MSEFLIESEVDGMLKKKGFTLIELLVVISIIALLLSILMPSLQKAKESAKRLVCQAQLKQWGTIFHVYAFDNKGRNHNFWPSLKPNDGWDTYLKRLAVEYYKPIYEDPDLLMCPASSPTNNRRGSRASWVNWTGSGLSGLTGSYGENLWTTNPENDQISYSGGEFDEKYFWKTLSAPGGDKVPMFMDSVCPYMFPKSSDGPPLTSDGQFTGGVDPIKYPCVDRHGRGTINILFLDMTVRKVELKELWTLKWSTHFKTDGPWTVQGGVTPDMWPPWMQKFPEFDKYN
jgi:prepilin-type N-terminal cleavage/methylation domain-containing protein